MTRIWPSPAMRRLCRIVVVVVIFTVTGSPVNGLIVSLFIVVSTALVSTAVGVLVLAASRVPAFVAVAVPGGLWLTKVPPQRDRDMRPRTWTSVLTLPFSRLYDRMGDDMRAWCDTRIEAAKPEPQWIADA